MHTLLDLTLYFSSSGKKTSIGSTSISDAEESPKHKPVSNRASSALSGQITESIVPVSPIKSSKSSDTIDGNANGPASCEIVNDLQKQACSDLLILRKKLS